MKKISGVLITTMIAGFLLLLIGCSAQKQQTLDFPEELMVTMDSDRQQLKVNEPVKITAKVKFGDIDIDKDTTVDFEIIENGVSVGTVSPEDAGDGKYTLETMFSSKGTHEVVAHVYYEWFHEMPKLTFNVSE